LILKKLSLIQIRTLHYIVFHKNTKKNLKIKDVRPFHYVRTSPWPIITSLSIIIILITSIEATLTRNFNTNWVITSTALTLAVIFMWWRDITRESNSGQHRIRTTKSIRMRIILFITSEVCFFFGFFWSFFWVAFEHKIGSSIQWPPSGILAFNPYRVPLLNRRILLTSGVTVTWSHKMICYNNHKEALYGIIITVILGVIFTMFQLYEYNRRFFSISDSVYGALFFMITGFHGIHVLVGTVMLIYRIKRIIVGQINSKHHNNAEFAIWYWHFVDIVWLMLYLWVYWWHYYFDILYRIFYCK